MVIESHAQSTHPGYFSLNFRDARNCDIHDNNTFSILFDPFRYKTDTFHYVKVSQSL